MAPASLLYPSNGPKRHSIAKLDDRFEDLALIKSPAGIALQRRVDLAAEVGLQSEIACLGIGTCAVALRQGRDRAPIGPKRSTAMAAAQPCGRGPSRSCQTPVRQAAFLDSPIRR